MQRSNITMKIGQDQFDCLYEFLQHDIQRETDTVNDYLQKVILTKLLLKFRTKWESRRVKYVTLKIDEAVALFARYGIYTRPDQLHMITINKINSLTIKELHNAW